MTKEKSRIKSFNKFIQKSFSDFKLLGKLGFVILLGVFFIIAFSSYALFQLSFEKSWVDLINAVSNGIVFTLLIAGSYISYKIFILPQSHTSVYDIEDELFDHDADSYMGSEFDENKFRHFAINISKYLAKLENKINDLEKKNN